MMPRPVKARWLLAAATFAVAAAPLAAQRVEVGIVSQSVGKARISAVEGADKQNVQLKQRVAWGNILETEKKSELQVLLLDWSSLKVPSNSRMEVTRMTYEPGKQRSLVARVLKGAFRFMSGQRLDDAEATIETLSASIGARGTMVEGITGKRAVEIAQKEEAIGNVDHDKKTATFALLRGPGPLTESGLQPGVVKVTAAEVTVTLDEPGEAAYVPRAGLPPIGPFKISPEGMSRVQDRIDTRVARANSGGVLDKVVVALFGAAVLAILLGNDGGGDALPPGTADNPDRDDTAQDPDQGPIQ